MLEPIGRQPLRSPRASRVGELIAFWLSLLISLLAVGGCTQPAPVAPTTAAEPTRPTAPVAVASPAPTIVPTAAPLRKVDAVSLKKPLTTIVPTAVGTIADMAARLAGPMLERELGVPVQVANRPSVAKAIEALSAQPSDGYTLMVFTIPGDFSGYLDPARKPAYARSDFVPVAGLFVDRLAIGVRMDSNFETPRDVVEYAKGKLADFAIGTSGDLSASHLGPVAWAEQTGARFSYFHFDSGVVSIPRLLAGRLDAVAVPLSSLGVSVRSGNIRLLGIMDDRESLLLPGVPTFAAQGYQVSAPTYYSLVAPKDTPAEFVQVVSAGVERVVAGETYRRKLADIGAEAKYLSASEVDALWTDQERWAGPLMEAARK